MIRREESEKEINENEKCMWLIPGKAEQVEILEIQMQLVKTMFARRRIL